MSAGVWRPKVHAESLLSLPALGVEDREVQGVPDRRGSLVLLPLLWGRWEPHRPIGWGATPFFLWGVGLARSPGASA